jgi:dipeptidyl aminopeptidase/acylaminoacyl peptidase
MVRVAPYGAWQSPISAADVAAAGGGLYWVEVHDGAVWWAESRPAQGGRVALLCSGRAGQPPVEVLADPWNARNRVHEYGGRPWTLLGDGTVVFTHWDDQRLYALRGGGTPRPISPEPARHHGYRYAEPLAGPAGEVWCVRETVTGDAPTDIHRDLVALPAGGAIDPAGVRSLAASHRFLVNPRLSPDGRHLAWIGWDHPAMPWDGTELCVAPVDGGVVGPHRVVAGGPTEAVCQAEWDGPDALLALTDPDGWWNLYRIGLDGTAANLAPVEDELGGPLWKPGIRWFVPLSGGRHAVLRGGRLAVLDEATATVTDVAGAPPVWQPMLAGDGKALAGVAGAPDREAAVLRLIPDGGDPEELTSQPAHLPDPGYLPRPVRRTFTTPDGQRVPAYLYPPTNPDHAAPDGELPPYVVYPHGGPTGSNSAGLDLELAFFTSRGFGVVLPDYGGSTGHGRAYRERLREQWGVVDVADCAAVADALVAEGTADPRRLIVRGGSAGGWTAAVSLTRTTTYRCGTALYPILDLLGWATGETHDFESQYLHSLVGPLPATQDRYVERSASTHPDTLAGPILLLQGLDDQICPPVQADRFAAALAGSGIPHAYLTFEGEQHGWRRAETIVAALEAELSFYGQVLGFVPSGVPLLALRT